MSDSPAKTSRGGSSGDSRTDEQLIAAYCAGDKEGFAQLVARYERELFHFLYRFLGDRAAAEDVFQEAFLQVHLSATTFDAKRRFKPWLFTIAANKGRDYLRSASRRATVPLEAAISPSDEESGRFVDMMKSAELVPGVDLEAAEERERVREVVMRMPENLREVLLLSYFHQFPYGQIGEILNIPLGTVKSRLHAAVAMFASRWAEIQQNRRGGR